MMQRWISTDSWKNVLEFRFFVTTATTSHKKSLKRLSQNNQIINVRDVKRSPNAINFAKIISFSDGESRLRNVLKSIGFSKCRSLKMMIRMSFDFSVFETISSLFKTDAQINAVNMLNRLHFFCSFVIHHSPFFPFLKFHAFSCETIQTRYSDK